MIAVIADDLTGAAELGGIGLRYNLDVEITTKLVSTPNADLLVISGDSRSKNREEAVSEMVDFTAILAQYRPTLIYKKVDSVLRGHVLDELSAQMKVLKLERALLVPSNPGLGRTIKDGTYHFQGSPIHLSSFSTDPEFAVRSSNVLDMLRANDLNIAVRKQEEGLPPEGIIVGEAVDVADLKAWAAQVDDKTFAVGAAGFFTALLDRILPGPGNPVTGVPPDFGQPALYVSGTTFNKKIEGIRNIKNNGGPVSYMPSEVIASPTPSEDNYRSWAAEVVAMLSEHGRAIIAIDPATLHGNETALSLRTKKALAVRELFNQVNIRELVVEGGSTGAAIIKSLDFTRFYPVQEITPGVVRMRVEDRNDLFLTLKPGSYEWSPEVWNF